MPSSAARMRTPGRPARSIRDAERSAARLQAALESLITVPDTGPRISGRKKPKKGRARKPAAVAAREKLLRAALEPLPARVRDAAREVASDRGSNAGVSAMLGRVASFANPTAAVMTGIALVPEARARFDERLDSMWRRDSERGVGIGRRSKTVHDEVVIGAGLHAAIYCAVRVARGFPAPLVLEEGARAGGAFAVSRGPSFYLNSRNRPGGLSIPGMSGALNFLPGAVVQPSDLGGSEYQTNSDLACAIRMTLAASARVYTGRSVSTISGGGGIDRPYALGLRNGSRLLARRVIFASGLRERAERAERGNVLTFSELMARMDDPFPLRGMKRVAVIGAGDSGKTALEALTGQGPASHWSVASLDWPEEIFWYGVPEDQLNRDGFERCSRSRYRGIGRLLAAADGRPGRVRPLVARGAVADGYACAYVNEVPFDHVISCVGYSSGASVSVPSPFEEFSVGGRSVGTRGSYGCEEMYGVGPAASLERRVDEVAALPSAAQRVEENLTALFRYANRTAALAASLG